MRRLVRWLDNEHNSFGDSKIVLKSQNPSTRMLCQPSSIVILWIYQRTCAEKVNNLSSVLEGNF